MILSAKQDLSKVFMRPIILSAIILLSQMSICYGSAKVTSGLKDDISSTLKATHNLQKTIKGIVFCLNQEKQVTVDPPNIFASTVKVAIPEPTGAIAIGGYTPTVKGKVYFFANEIHARVKDLIASESALSHNGQGNKKLESHFSNINKNMYDLEIRDQYIQSLQSLMNSTYDAKWSNLSFAREVLAMAEDAKELKAILNSSKKEIENKSQKSSSLAMTNREKNETK